jgi:hypothetical protein
MAGGTDEAVVKEREGAAQETPFAFEPDAVK